METIQLAEFLSSALIPPALLFISWLLTKKQKLGSRIAFTGLSVLASLPAGFVCIFSIVGWTYVFNLHHNPGVAVVLLPLITATFVCFVFWACWTMFALANRVAASRKH